MIVFHMPPTVESIIERNESLTQCVESLTQCVESLTQSIEKYEGTQYIVS